MVKPDRARYVWLYCHSVDEKKRYQELANNAGIPLSKFLIGVIDDALASREGEENRVAIAKELDVLKEENRKLKEDLRLRGLLIDKLEADAKSHRAETFLDNSFTGFRTYDIELIETIRNYGPLQTSRLLEKLEIGPEDIEQIEALSRQLESLEGHGLIQRSSKGWWWKK